jgi:hypothetical protein
MSRIFYTLGILGWVVDASNCFIKFNPILSGIYPPKSHISVFGKAYRLLNLMVFSSQQNILETRMLSKINALRLTPTLTLSRLQTVRSMTLDLGSSSHDTTLDLLPSGMNI